MNLIFSLILIFKQSNTIPVNIYSPSYFMLKKVFYRYSELKNDMKEYKNMFNFNNKKNLYSHDLMKSLLKEV